MLTLAGPKAETATLLLSGLAISALAGALTTLALALAPSPFAFYDAYDWLMGSLIDRSLEQAAFAAIPAVLTIALLLRLGPALDRLALGEEVAQSLGDNIARLRLMVICLSALGVGACVAICGAIGFIGLIAPIFARRLTRGHPGRAILASALIGALLLSLADLTVRLAPLGRTLPIGVVTALDRRAILPVAGRAYALEAERMILDASGLATARAPVRRVARHRGGRTGLPGRSQWQRQDQPAPRACRNWPADRQSRHGWRRPAHTRTVAAAALSHLPSRDTRHSLAAPRARPDRAWWR